MSTTITNRKSGLTIYGRFVEFREGGTFLFRILDTSRDIELVGADWNIPPSLPTTPGLYQANVPGLGIQDAQTLRLTSDGTWMTMVNAQARSLAETLQLEYGLVQLMRVPEPEPEPELEIGPNEESDQSL